MTKITYKKLMQKIEDGYAEVTAWSFDSPEGQVAEVTFFTDSGRPTRKMVLVTGCPETQS